MYRIATRPNKQLYSVQATCTARNLKRRPRDQAKRGRTNDICKKQVLERRVVWKVQKDGLLPSVFRAFLATILAPFLAFLLGRLDLRARSARRINLSVLARETPSTSAVSAAEANPLRMIALDIVSPVHRIPFSASIAASSAFEAHSTKYTNRCL